MSVLISDEAEQDLIEIFVYSLKNFGEEKANSYLQDLKHFFASIDTFQSLGKSLKKYGIESNLVFFREQAIFYEINGGDTKIIRIINQNQDFMNFISHNN